jgi:A/G-specific adenine glycosylase
MTSSKNSEARVSARFARRLLRWYDRHGRHDLPWQHPRTPYRVWLAEIMLQQTQVATVIPYYRRFLKRFPSLRTLAAAPLDDVLALWSGLGYYARARNLHRAAQHIVAQHAGRFPRDIDTLLRLPGIGRSTAGAILAQAFGQRHPILDGNARRVLARHAGIAGWPGDAAVQQRLWKLAESLLPLRRLADYTQALMDLGATVCTTRTPDCGACPARADCRALATDRVTHIPATRPRRERPRRSAHLLLIENGRGAVLLQRRPPAGLWGGLWCPPLVEGQWRKTCRRYGLRVQQGKKLAAVKHRFTHFDLDLQPLRVHAPDDRVTVSAADSAWVTLPQSLRYGLPAPVRRILQSLEPASA